MLKSFKEHQNFPLIVAGTSYAVLASVSAFCWYFYYTQIVRGDFWHYAFITYSVMFLNGLSGFTEFIHEDSFWALRDLLDYAQLVLTLPCYAAEVWIKNEVGPQELALLHAAFGFLALAVFIFLEYKRQDLTDLAVFSNLLSMLVVAAVYEDPLAGFAATVFAVGYCLLKRSCNQCCLALQDRFNFLMAGFAVVSLVSFDPALIQDFRSKFPAILGSG
ncbi:uncharacterized protein LOC132697082 isoform X2 [Cylas formicarius]|nr:uncharacterized protein LOC132697082 isoform X2 [Cylas formicarius]